MTCGQMMSRWQITWNLEVCLGEETLGFAAQFHCHLRMPLDVYVKILINRRVHITEETLGHLNGAFKVQESDGGSRDPLLKGRKTYLVVDPQNPEKISRRLNSVCISA